MKLHTRRILTAIAFAMIAALCAGTASAQTRLSDKDLTNMMKNLRDDAKTFRSLFNKALSKSTIRKTSQEKDAQATAQQFENNVQAMLDQFNSSKKVDATLPSVMQTATQIEKIKADTPLGPSVNAKWAKVRTELDAISAQFTMGT